MSNAITSWWHQGTASAAEDKTMVAKTYDNAKSATGAVWKRASDGMQKAYSAMPDVRQHAGRVYDMAKTNPRAAIGLSLGAVMTTAMSIFLCMPEDEVPPPSTMCVYTGIGC